MILDKTKSPEVCPKVIGPFAHVIEKDINKIALCVDVNDLILIFPDI